MSECKFDGCQKQADSRGWCNTHYERWRKYGDPNITLKRPKGTGCATGTGYWHIKKGNRRLGEHTWVAEAALGKPLPVDAVVHHIDCNPLNNTNNNLLICTKQYHSLLHMRLRAFRESGHADYRKCWLCKKYDSPSNMAEVKRAKGSYFYHHKCVREKYAERKGKTV